jgi:hypothetical protein
MNAPYKPRRFSCRINDMSMRVKESMDYLARYEPDLYDFYLNRYCYEKLLKN